MIEPQISQLRVHGTFVAQYVLKKPAPKTPARSLVLVLHGYQQEPAFIFEKFAGSFPDESTILACSGPFPVPRRVSQEGRAPAFKLGYSWYFYDPATDEYRVDMQSALEYLDVLIGSLGLSGVPIRVLGYSQGGYLAPFFAHRNPLVTQVIGVACRFLDEELLALPGGRRDFRMDSVHGQDDEVVNAAEARLSNDRLREAGFPATFTCIPGVGHRITAEMQQAVRELLRP